VELLAHLLPCRLGEFSGLRVQGTRCLLHCRAVSNPAREVLDLLVSFPAGPGADNEPGDETGGERDAVPHLHLSLPSQWSRVCSRTFDFPVTAISIPGDGKGTPPGLEANARACWRLGAPLNAPEVLRRPSFDSASMV
jgi:hypothetical protein